MLKDNVNLLLKRTITLIGLVKLDFLPLIKVKVLVLHPISLLLDGTDGLKSGTLTTLLDIN